MSKIYYFRPLFNFGDSSYILSDPTIDFQYVSSTITDHGIKVENPATTHSIWYVKFTITRDNNDHDDPEDLSRPIQYPYSVNANIPNWAKNTYQWFINKGFKSNDIKFSGSENSFYINSESDSTDFNGIHNAIWYKSYADKLFGNIQNLQDFPTERSSCHFHYVIEMDETPEFILIPFPIPRNEIVTFSIILMADITQNLAN